MEVHQTIKFIISSYSIHIRHCRIGSLVYPVQLNPTITQQIVQQNPRSAVGLGGRFVGGGGFNATKEPTTKLSNPIFLLIYLLKSLIKRLRAGVDIIYLQNIRSGLGCLCLGKCVCPSHAASRFYMSLCMIVLDFKLPLQSINITPFLFIRAFSYIQNLYHL